MGRQETAALIAAAVHEPDRARQLLAQDPALRDSRYTNGETALHYLAIENQLAAVELLLQCGCDPNAPNEYGDAPLVDVVVLQLVDMARLLLHYGANPDASSEVRGPALHIAAVAGHADLVELLLRARASLVYTTLLGETWNDALAALSPGQAESMRDVARMWGGPRP